MSTLTGFNGPTTAQWQQIICVGAQKLRIQVSNAAILLNFGIGQPVPQWESETEPYLPIVGSIVRPFDAVRIMSLTPAFPAQVLLIPSVQ